MNDLMTVIRFTFGNKMRSKAFKVTSVILVLIISLGIHVPYLISLFSNDDLDQYGVIQDAGQIAAALETYVESQPEPEFLVKVYPDPGADQLDTLIEDEIAAGEVEGFIVFSESEEGAFPSVTYKSEGSLDFTINSTLQNALYNIKNEIVLNELQLTDAQKQQLSAPIQITNEQISVGGGGNAAKSESEMFMAYGMVYVLMIMLFMAIMITGQLIATEITAEKSSRVMEILVTSVAPLKQMFGKIIGMLLIGLFQIVLFIVVSLVNINLPHNKDAMGGLNINFGDVDPKLYVFFAIFYLMGYFLYATLFAGVGSIVSRTEDLGQAIMPITMLSLASFYIGIYGLADPNSPFIIAMSYVPFFSPLIMFLRIGMADPAWWEIAISIGLLAVAIFFLGWLAAKIYRTGVLMYGKRPTFKELRKAMKAFKV